MICCKLLSVTQEMNNTNRNIKEIKHIISVEKKSMPENKIFIKPENKMCKRRSYCKQSKEEINAKHYPILLYRHFSVSFGKEPEQHVIKQWHCIKHNVIPDKNNIIKPEISWCNIFYQPGRSNIKNTGRKTLPGKSSKTIRDFCFNSSFTEVA